MTAQRPRADLLARMRADLLALSVGMAVPVEVYIQDYRGGSIPDWWVTEREELGAGVVRLEVEDRSNAGLFEAPRATVLVMPTKILRSPLYSSAGAPRLNMLCDLVQNAAHNRSDAATLGGAA